jgi:hypothetical protein
MKKRHASLYPAFERPALPVLPCRSRCLVRPTADLLHPWCTDHASPLFTSRTALLRV